MVVNDNAALFDSECARTESQLRNSPHQMNISRSARSALGSGASSSLVTLEVTHKAHPPFTFKRRVSNVTEVLNERPSCEAAESRYGSSWHSIGRTLKEASAEKQVKSQRKVIYDEADRIAHCNGLNGDAAALVLESQFSGETAWLVDEFGSPPNEKKRTLTNFINFLKKKKKKKKALISQASNTEESDD